MKTKVLVVDDDQQTCQLIKTILVSAGMDVAFLTDSRAAAARLHTEKIDLLFLDLHMPKHGGFDLLNSVRGSGVNRRTPVVMITGDQDPKVLARGFEAGANFFLFKPIELNRLMRLVRATEAAVYRERRRFQRVSVSRRAVIAAKGERVEGSTLDVSLGGMMFRGDRTLELETRVDAEIHFGAGRKPVQAAGRVARTLDDGCMGIEFLQLKPEDAERLQEFLLPMILEPKEPNPRAS